jgi:hypothetical protein
LTLTPLPSERGEGREVVPVSVYVGRRKSRYVSSMMRAMWEDLHREAMSGKRGRERRHMGGRGKGRRKGQKQVRVGDRL